MRLLPALIVLPLLLSACGATLTGSVTPDEMDMPEKEQSAEVTEYPVLPNFTVMGAYVMLDGERTMVFEYPDENAAAADQAKVSADGRSINGVSVPWGGPVHFFRSGRVIVVYEGSNDAILTKLRADAGDQFAGN